MKGSGDIAIELKGDGSRPVFLDLALSIVEEIERGRLKPGDSLPGTRALAKSLRINRNTVDAAFHELIMQGWLATEPSRGTFVARDLPDLSSRRRARTPAADPAPAETAEPPRLLVSDGTPDSRIMPYVELTRAFRRVFSVPSFRSELTYGDPRGALSLRHALAEYLACERGLTAGTSELIVTRGSQMGLFLAASAITDEGGAIAVEVPGYSLAWAAFRAAGARIIGVPVDDLGIDVERLDLLAQKEPRLKAVYVTPHHQYPTTVTLGAGRRLRLLDVAKRYGLTVIEDDYDHEYRFDGRPVLPLAARAEPDLSIIYIGSLSKMLAPAVRLGYAVARSDIVKRMADRREVIDRLGDLPLEKAVASMIVEGELARHARKARRIYEERRNFLAHEVERLLGDDATFAVPAGGLAMWLRLRSGVSADIWAASAARAGLSISPGARFALDIASAPEAFRFGYASLNESEIGRAVELLARTRPAAR